MAMQDPRPALDTPRMADPAGRPQLIATSQSRPLIALFWMVGASLSFAAMAVAGREIQAEMNTFELMLYRSCVGFVITALILWRRPRGFAETCAARPELHVKRNIVHFAGQNFWFFAITAIPLGQMVALEFTNPIWVALLAPVMLGETLTRYRLLAALIGFAGVLVVARPGTAPIEIGHGAALLAAVMFAVNTIFTKQIMRFDTVLCVIFWMTLSQAGMSLILALPGGIPFPSRELWPWIVVVGLAGLTAHYALTSALAEAQASIVAPMEFIRLPIFALVGLWIYGESLHATILVGGILIVAGNMLNLHRERRRSSE